MIIQNGNVNPPPTRLLAIYYYNFRRVSEN